MYPSLTIASNWQPPRAPPNRPRTVQTLWLMQRDLAALLRSGNLTDGTSIYHRQKGGQVEARIVAGGVQLEGKTFASLSTAALAVTGHRVNGWTFWRVRRDGRTLADVRREMRDGTGPAT